MNEAMRAAVDGPGLKRRIIVGLAVLADILRSIPGLESFSVALDQFIGALGGLAVGHAAVRDTLPEEIVGAIVALLYVLIAIAYWVPALTPFQPLLYKLVGLLAAARTGVAIRNTAHKMP